MSNAKPTVLIVDDHPVASEGLAAMLGSRRKYRILTPICTGEAAIEACRAKRPDVLILDLQLPDISGLVVARRVLALDRAIRILVISTFAFAEEVRDAAAAGVRGYLLKTAARQELCDAIDIIHAGGRYFPPAIASVLAESLNAEQLTPREIGVLRLVAEGQSNKQIASVLRLSSLTVKWHVQSLLFKLSAKDRTHAVVIALRTGKLKL